MNFKFASLMLASSGLIGFACSSGVDTQKKPLRTTEFRNVPIVKVGSTKIQDFYEATGTVKAKTATQIAANTSGRITSFPANEGDRVMRGQVLVEIDNSENKAVQEKAEAGLKEAQASLLELDRSAEGANAAVRTAEASRQLADRTFKRFRELHERRSVSEQEFDEARSRFDAAISELERARANLSSILAKNKQINARIEQAKADVASTKVRVGYSTIVAPVAGVIVKKFAESGATALPGVPLVSIEDTSHYFLEASVEETSSRFVKVGNSVEVRVDAIGQEGVVGSISEVLPTSDPASRSYTIKIQLPPNPLLRTGLYGVGRIPLASKEAITIPLSAIAQRGQLTGVYVVGPDGAANFRLVRTGKSSDGMVELLSGVSDGIEIVSSGVETLTDGAKVR